MANVIERDVKATVERQAQLIPSLCNCDWGSYAAEGACEMGGIGKQ